jgi:hypothetical protein
VTLTSAASLDRCALRKKNAPPGLLKEIDRMLDAAATDWFTD